ncbi:MAG: phasin family protein [Paracoccaceae bacterium]
MGKSKKKAASSEAGASAMTAAMAALNPVAGAAWLELMNESARFVSDRFKQDLETQKALLDCKSPTDLMRVQSEFYQKAIEQYAAETTRMIEMMSKATQQSLDEAKSSHARGYDDVPL